MEKEEFGKWQELFETYRKERDDNFKKLLQMAEKFGRLAEGTKSELKKLTEKFDTPFWKTDGFYKTIIIASAICIALLAAIITRICISVKISDYAFSASCNDMVRRK